MRPISSRHTVLLTLTICLSLVGGCGGTGIFVVDDPQSPSVFGADPIIANKAALVTILGDHLFDSSDVTVTIGGVPCQIQFIKNSEIIILIPNNIVPGQIKVSSGAGSDVAAANFIVGNQDYVDEVEPNDDPLGGNATVDGGNRLFRGNLSSVSDQDNLKFIYVPSNTPYRIHIEPKIVSSIKVDGAVRSLDSEGNCIVGNPGYSILLGITGGTGAYTVSLSRVIN